jgi:hypothetical protein
MAFTLSPDILDLWRGYARRCGFPFPEPPTDEAVVQLARDLLLFALPALTDDTPTPDDDFKNVVRTVYEPTVLGDLDSIEQEILTNPELADGDWPDDFRADLPYNIDLFYGVPATSRTACPGL